MTSSKTGAGGSRRSSKPADPGVARIGAGTGTGTGGADALVEQSSTASTAACVGGAEARTADVGAEALAEQAETLFRAFRAVRRRVLARPLGLTSLPGSHLELLNLVRRQPGIRTGEAARTLRLASTTVSTLAHRLADAGLLERRRDASDHRGVQFFLASAAAAELADWRDQRLGLLRRALAELDPQDQAKIQAALPALGQLVALVHQQAQR